MRVGFLITGSEVLSGKTRDTNGPFMGMHLRRYGIPVIASMMCADEEQDLLECLSYLAKRSDIILMTGGLGPTSDDLTANIIAKFFQIKTEFNDAAWQNCVDFYKKLGRTDIPESNKKQAQLPENCTLLPNSIGTAIGFASTGTLKQNAKSVTVFCMPGVPYEMEKMFIDSVMPKIMQGIESPAVKTWKIFSLGESAIQNMLADCESELKNKFPNYAVSYQAHPSYVTYTVTLFKTKDYSTGTLQQYLDKEYSLKIKNTLGKYILYENDKNLSDHLAEKLKKQKKSLAFAETSCGGYLSKEFSISPQSSLVFSGSIIANSKNLLQKLFEICPANKAKYIEKWLASIAEKTALKTGAHIVLAEHGVASEEDAHALVPYGRFYFAMLFENTQYSELSLSKIENILNEFGWKAFATEDTNYTVFINQLDINKRYDSDTMKTRAALYALCSLILIS